MKNSPLASPIGCFVTGTDTAVGKTVVTAALALYLRTRQVSVGVMKPIETGVDSDFPQLSDAGLLQTIAEVHDPLSVICPYAFQDPLAPLSAARRQGVSITMDSIRGAYHLLSDRYTCMLVEGAGGVMVPVAKNLFLLDVMAMCRLPLVVVGHAALGGINHLLLTVDRIQRESLPLLAIVLNQMADVSSSSLLEQQMASTIELVSEFSNVPVLGPLLPVQGPLTTQSSLAPLARSAVIQDLGELVMAYGSKTT